MFLYTLYLQDKHVKITGARDHQDTFQNVFDRLYSVSSLEEIDMTVWNPFLTSPALHHISRDVLVEHCFLSIRVHYKHAKVEFWRSQWGYCGSQEDGDDVTTSRCSGGFEQIEICNIHTNRWWGTMSTFIVWSPNAQAHRVKKKSVFTGNNSIFSCYSKVLWGLKEKKNQTELLHDWTMACNAREFLDQNALLNYSVWNCELSDAESM